jgi:hypothetical protein
MTEVTQAQEFDAGHSFYERQLALTRWFVMAQIGQELKERYQVAEELPPTLLALLIRLDDRDLLFPGGSWQDDVDLLGGRVQR